LSPQQQTALKQLFMGATISEAAQAAGVTRQTVSEWCNHHDAFQDELSERRTSALRDAQQQLEEAALLAMEVLSEIAQATPATAHTAIEQPVRVRRVPAPLTWSA
jgi:transposase-like protein